ncbi:hypothetical protein ACFSJ3_00400 [Corallincola platygyrae]|uniref:Secreted protein n=1 Tax=Corallincola platygyrae TaxID=1193278 RepID=A0ABW4XG25_9GAMM
MDMFFRAFVFSLCALISSSAFANDPTGLPVPNWQLLASPAAGEIKYQHLKTYDDELTELTGYLDHGAAYAELLDRGKNEQAINLITATLRPYAHTDAQAEHLLGVMAHWRAYAKFHHMMLRYGDSNDPEVRQALMTTYRKALESDEENRAMQMFQHGCEIESYLLSCLSRIASLNEQTMLCVLDSTHCPVLMEELARAEQALVKVAEAKYEQSPRQKEIALILAMTYRGDLLPLDDETVAKFKFPRDEKLAEDWANKNK